MKVNKRWVWGVILAGLLSSGVASAQRVDPTQRGVERAIEANSLRCPVGVLSSLPKVQKDFWNIDAQDSEAQYLSAISSAQLGRSDAEVKLLHFIESYPHSSYIHHAYAALGQVYYVGGNYRSAIYWLRQVETALLTEQMGAGVEFYLAYAYLQEGQLIEALRLFEPLTYYEGWQDDALFYAGYILLKEGDLYKGQSYLRKVVDHEIYGAYALAYLSEGALAEMRYSEALSLAQRGLQLRALDSVVKSSLYRSAGLASSQLGDRDGSVRFLSQYIQMSEAPGRVEQLVLGKDLFELGRYNEATQYLMYVADGGSDFMGQLSLYYTGLAKLSLRQTDLAISSFDRARSIVAHPAISEAASYNAAVASYAKDPGKVGDGSQRLARFLDQYPASEYRSLVIGYLSDAFLNEPNSQVALAELNKVSPLPQELENVRDRVKLKQANKALSSGDAQSARRQYDEIIAKGGDRESVAEAYLWRGEAAYRAKEYQEAIDSTEGYLKHRPESLPLNPNAYYTLGYAHFNLGNYGEAERYFKQYEQVIEAPTPEQKTAINNRLGDIAMQRRAYDTAIQYYARAEQAGGNEADYALFNRAMVKGLQRDYRDKATLMGNLPTRFPHSTLVDEAIYEQGRALQLAKETKRAQRVYSDFLAQKRHSPFSSKVALQLALSYYAENQLDEAVEAYERVVRHYPNSPEAVSALQDLKSISVQLNRVDSYAKLIDEVGVRGVVSPVEMDSLAYIAAESVLAKGKPVEAVGAFDSYLANYPNGAFVNNARYGKALIKYEAKDYRGVVSDLSPEVKHFTGKLARDGYRLLASSYEQLNEPGRGAEAYYALAQITSGEEERSSWLVKSVECAERSESLDFVRSVLQQIGSGKLSVNDQAEAETYLAHAKMEARNNHKANALSSARKVLSLRDYGGHVIAEIIVALDLQDKGDYKTVQQKMLKVTNTGTTDAYWLARAFILLSDSYMGLGDKETARLYLESVKGSYENRDDGILKMIDDRLAKL